MSKRELSWQTVTKTQLLLQPAAILPQPKFLRCAQWQSQACVKSTCQLVQAALCSQRSLWPKSSSSVHYNAAQTPRSAYRSVCKCKFTGLPGTILFASSATGVNIPLRHSSSQNRAESYCMPGCKVLLQYAQLADEHSLAVVACMPKACTYTIGSWLIL